MIYVLAWIIFGVIAGYVYQHKGYSQTTGFLGGLILGPIGVILAILSPSRLKKCPYCGEFIRPEAKVCRYCGRDLTEEVSVSNAKIER